MIKKLAVVFFGILIVSQIANAEINPTRRWQAVEQVTQNVGIGSTAIVRTKPGYVSIYAVGGGVRIQEMGATANSQCPLIAQNSWGITGYKLVSDPLKAISDTGATVSVTVIVNQYINGPQ